MPQLKLKTETDRQFFRRHWPVVILLSVWMVVNLLVGWFMKVGGPNVPSGLPAYGSFGVIASEFVLIAIVFALFPAGLLFRTATVCLATLALFFSLAIGVSLFNAGDVREVLETIHGWPIILLAFTTPFLLAKHFLGWRIEVDSMEPPENSNLTVAGMMAATTLVAVAVSALRLGDQKGWVPTLIVAAGCAGVCFVVFVPLTLLMFRSGRAGVWLVGICLVAFGLSVSVMMILARFLPGGGFWQIMGFSFSVMSLVAWYSIGLRVVFGMGARLRLPRDS